jgi:hypothetical protein
VNAVDLVRLAARNNAEWCDTVCRSHGRPGHFGAASWTNPARTPPHYPDAVTLVPRVGVDDVLRAIDVESPGCSVKDSFCDLDLSPSGFQVLFEASWMTHDGPTDRASSWSVVVEPRVLVEWEEAWSSGSSTGLFRPVLLDDPLVAVVCDRRDRGIGAGAILNLSEDVVGVSNMFAVDGDLEAAWAGCLGLIAERLPRVPIVGYESGRDLETAQAAGFRSLGPLRVWMKDA